MLKNIFSKPKYATIRLVNNQSELEVSKENHNTDVQSNKNPVYSLDGLWVKCGKCEKVIYIKELEENCKICSSCGQYFRMNAYERVNMIVDQGTFIEYFDDIETVNVLNYPNYEEKILDEFEKSNSKEAVVCGTGEIDGYGCVICAMNPFFIMGSMGTVVGEKITRAVELAIELRYPIIIFSASGGARMQEGIFSLMQMAKCSSAIARLNKERLLYISVITDPTTGGVTASYAFQGDIIIAEPKALIGFAGPRVIEQTIKQKLPQGFQTSEFLMEKGFIDMIVERNQLKENLSKILKLHSKGDKKNE